VLGFDRDARRHSNLLDLLLQYVQISRSARRKINWLWNPSLLLMLVLILMLCCVVVLVSRRLQFRHWKSISRDTHPLRPKVNNKEWIFRWVIIKWLVNKRLRKISPTVELAIRQRFSWVRIPLKHKNQSWFERSRLTSLLSALCQQLDSFFFFRAAQDIKPNP